MPIPESQLSTWSSRSQTNTAVKAHDDIRTALRAPVSNVSGVNFQDFLQGSYRNYTNIVRDHDVDVVIQLDQSFFYDIDGLAAGDQAWYRQVVTPATYTLDQFRDGVLRTLRSTFGPQAVQMADKAVKVKGASGVKLDADVLICQQYRRYLSFDGDLSRGFIEGVNFQSQEDGRWIVNYPKLHYDNGVRKHEETSEWFKPVVRIFKNARSYMRDHGQLAKGNAPSYFIQCLLYNVPSPQFGVSYQATVVNALNWLNQADLGTLVCQNGQIYLCGQGPEQWSIPEAKAYLAAMIALWNNW